MCKKLCYQFLTETFSNTGEHYVITKVVWGSLFRQNLILLVCRQGKEDYAEDGDGWPYFILFPSCFLSPGWDAWMNI